MNVYEKKLEARKSRFESLSVKARRESSSVHGRANKLSDMIPMGQPILVGHHSERRHRRHLAKINDMTRKAINLSDKADYFARKAASVGKGGISSDDPDAVEKLKEQLTGLVEKQERMKAVNKALKKNDVAAIEKMGYTSAQILKLQTPDFAGRTGYPSFQLTNNNANIRRIKKRIEELEKIALSASQEIKKVFGEITYLEADNRVQLLFPDKPAEAIRKILKDHGFRFSPSRNNAWVRHLNNAGRYAAERAIKKISEL